LQKLKNVYPISKLVDNRDEQLFGLPEGVRYQWHFCDFHCNYATNVMALAPGSLTFYATLNLFGSTVDAPDPQIVVRCPKLSAHNSFKTVAKSNCPTCEINETFRFVLPESVEENDGSSGFPVEVKGCLFCSYDSRQFLLCSFKHPWWPPSWKLTEQEKYFMRYFTVTPQSTHSLTSGAQQQRVWRKMLFFSEFTVHIFLYSRHGRRKGVSPHGFWTLMFS